MPLPLEGMQLHIKKSGRLSDRLGMTGMGMLPGKGEAIGVSGLILWGDTGVTAEASEHSDRPLAS
jgi:hypothetical protein